MSASLRKMLKSHDRASTKSDLLVSQPYEQYLASHPNILIDETVAEFVKKELTTPQRNRRMTFSASARGACAREQVFQFTPVTPVPKTNASLYAIFHHGTFMHLKWQALLSDAGILDELEISCTWQAYRLSGTIDGAGEIPASHPLRENFDRFGWELKSINSNGFRWVIDRGPSSTHLLQIHAYMLATGWRVWSLCYENKDTQEWKEFVVHFDEKIAEDVENELIYLNEHVDDKQLPPVLDECKKRQGAFKKCAFAHVCLETETWPERRIKLG